MDRELFDYISRRGKVSFYSLSLKFDLRRLSNLKELEKDGLIKGFVENGKKFYRPASKSADNNKHDLKT